jgi:hypothetical protein
VNIHDLHHHDVGYRHWWLNVMCHIALSLTPLRLVHTVFVQQTWGMGSGCSPFYNTCKEGTANTHMKRFFDEDRFEIYATRDIKAGEELLHTYISLKWRTCFQDLNEIVHADDSEHKSDD